jgi:hypothetical protein
MQSPLALGRAAAVFAIALVAERGLVRLMGAA